VAEVQALNPNHVSLIQEILSKQAYFNEREILTSFSIVESRGHSRFSIIRRSRRARELLKICIVLVLDTDRRAFYSMKRPEVLEIFLHSRPNRHRVSSINRFMSSRSIDVVDEDHVLVSLLRGQSGANT